MGCWLMSQNDPYAPAGSAARAAFSVAFTGKEKQGNAVTFCKAEVIQVSYQLKALVDKLPFDFQYLCPRKVKS